MGVDRVIVERDKKKEWRLGKGLLPSRPHKCIPSISFLLPFYLQNEQKMSRSKREDFFCEYESPFVVRILFVLRRVGKFHFVFSIVSL